MSPAPCTPMRMSIRVESTICSAKLMFSNSSVTRETPGGINEDNLSRNSFSFNIRRLPRLFMKPTTNLEVEGILEPSEAVSLRELIDTWETESTNVLTMWEYPKDWFKPHWRGFLTLKKRDYWMVKRLLGGSVAREHEVHGWERKVSKLESKLLSARKTIFTNETW